MHPSPALYKHPLFTKANLHILFTSIATDMRTRLHAYLKARTSSHHTNPMYNTHNTPIPHLTPYTELQTVIDWSTAQATVLYVNYTQAHTHTCPQSHAHMCALSSATGPGSLLGLWSHILRRSCFSAGSVSPSEATN